MHIQWLSILNLPPLESVAFDCDQRVNLFVGPNACGKSTILRAIKELHSKGVDHVSGAVEFNSRGMVAPSIAMRASDDWRHASGYDNPTKWDEVPLFYVPAVRVHLPGRDVLRRTLQTREEGERWSFVPFAALLANEDDIFYGTLVEEAIDDLPSFFSDPNAKQELQGALHVGYACAKDICSEIISETVPTQIRGEYDGEGERSYTPGTHDSMKVFTYDDILGDPLYAGELSAGTQNTLLWTWSLALHIVANQYRLNHHLWREGWEKRSAILLIDEIENHLHPTWQRRVIPALLKHFPGLQIFATTHSPFVVAGLKAGQVHLLKRDEEGRVTATTNPEDIVGWTADEILRTMMGVDDPTDDATADAARKLRQLRNEGPLEDETAEAQRQAQIQELRKKVNRDLLAGGPMAAQRQLFEEQFAKSLEEYRRSRDLNQENS